MRKIFEVSNAERMVKVFYYHDLDEYVGRLYVNGTRYEPADYFADDRQDAIDTAMEMVKPLPKGDASMGEDVTITDPLVKMFGRTRSQIESSIRASRPGSIQNTRLLERRAQVARAWRAFQGPKVYE